MSSITCIKTQDTWTDDRVDTLRSMKAAKASAGEIAAVLGLSRNSVIGKLNRLGLLGKSVPARANRYGNRITVPKPVRKTPFRKPKPQPAPERQRDADGKLPADDISRFETPSDGHGVTLFELNNDTCRWPKGDVGEPDFVFCGDAADLSDGRPYCHQHMRMRAR